jgi:hypothetical protein
VASVLVIPSADLKCGAAVPCGWSGSLLSTVFFVCCCVVIKGSRDLSTVAVRSLCGCSASLCAAAVCLCGLALGSVV